MMAPRVVDGVRVYAIGDIHGRADLLDDVLLKIDADLAVYPGIRPIQIFLGDYVDRGPDSCGVLDRLIRRAQTHEVIFLKGNHELQFLEFLQNPAVLKEWRKYGGLDTLMSYGLTVPLNANAEQLASLTTQLADVMPVAHRDFLNRLEVSFVCGDYYFVHAGVRPRVPLVFQRQEDLLWIRDEFLQSEDDFGKVVVHGHTPVPKPEFRHNRINIDTGAYATGKLTCLILEEDRRWFI